MTQKEKAQRYIEALERARKLHKDAIDMGENIWAKQCEIIFPELAESEEDKIRKDLIEWIDDFPDPIWRCHHKKDVIAWLEKQGEKDVRQKFLEDLLVADDIYQMSMNEAMVEEARTKAINALSELEISKLLGIEKQGEQKETLCEKCKKAQPSHSCQDITALGRCAVEHEQKTADDVEPKFHEGEWITNGDYTWKIVEVKPLDYILQSQDGNIVDDTISHVDEHFHSFTIQDAKDGDVLACENGWTCIFKTLINDENFSSYCFMDNTKWFCETGSECHTLNKEFMKAYNGETKPATKEQRDALERAITNAGYRWDKEKLKLEKI